MPPTLMTLRMPFVMERTIYACVVLAFALSTTPSGAAFKCWTNNDGVRECGNTIPPEYAQQRSEEINERGITTNVRERAKTADELKLEQREKQMEERRREEEALQRRQQAAYDRMLLSTFITEEAIIESRDRKLEAIDGTIEVTRLTVEKLERKLEQYRERAAGIERSGREIPADLSQNIESAQMQIDENRLFVSRKEEEKAALRTQYRQDIERFRELKTGR